MILNIFNTSVHYHFYTCFKIWFVQFKDLMWVSIWSTEKEIWCFFLSIYLRATIWVFLALLYKSRLATCIYLCEKKCFRCNLSNSNNSDESNIHIARWNFWWPLLSIDIISLILCCSISCHKMHLNLLIALFGRHIPCFSSHALIYNYWEWPTMEHL